MFTREELRAIPLFANLGEKELDYLADASADIRVQKGEYVVHEGESHRALIVTVEGSLEVVKMKDGVDQPVGIRKPGDLFGEVPVVLNTPFLAGLRAAQPSRVLRVEVKDFHIIAAAAPEISATVGTSAFDRVEGLQDLAAERCEPDITVVGPQWDDGCHQVRQFLDRNSVDYNWYKPEDAAVASLGLDAELNDGLYPIVQLKDCVLVQPLLREVADHIGLTVRPQHSEYDVVIIGGGPAGLAAAVYGASEGLSTILIECQAPGGQAGTSSRIENYLGFPFGVSGDELANRALQQARRLGAEIVVTRKAQRMSAQTHAVYLDEHEVLRGRTIVIAPGVAWRRLNIPSVEALSGKGVYYGTARGDARMVTGQDIHIIGGGNSAGQAAINFSNYAKSVTVVVRGDSLAKSMSHYLIEQIKTKNNIRVDTQSEVVNAYGQDHLEAIDVTNRVTEQTTRRDAAALFVMIGADAETEWLPPEIERDARGYVLTGPAVSATGHWALERDPYLLETTVPGIFAVGDVRAGSVKRVAAGVGEGSMAIAFVHPYLASLTEAAPALSLSKG